MYLPITNLNSSIIRGRTLGGDYLFSGSAHARGESMTLKFLLTQTISLFFNERSFIKKEAKFLKHFRKSSDTTFP